MIAFPRTMVGNIPVSRMIIGTNWFLGYTHCTEGKSRSLKVDWVGRIIQNAKKPVMTIKTMAAGQIRPYQALTFTWNAIRECDMVAVGTMAPEEARELVDLSLEILEHRPVTRELQQTRSKATVVRRALEGSA